MPGGVLMEFFFGMLAGSGLTLFGVFIMSMMVVAKRSDIAIEEDFQREDVAR
jgi:hypothetical protein